MLNEAALEAIRRNGKAISKEDVYNAIDRILQVHISEGFPYTTWYMGLLLCELCLNECLPASNSITASYLGVEGLKGAASLEDMCTAYFLDRPMHGLLQEGCQCVVAIRCL